MGEDHQRVQRVIAPWREHPTAHDDRPSVTHHPSLAGELALDRGHHLLARVGLGRVQRQPAVLDHVEREGQVVAHDRVDEQVRVAARGVNRTVAPRHRPQPRLQSPHGHLIAPVEPLLIGSALVDEAHVAADVAHARIREARDQPAQRVGLPDRIGVREGDDFAVSALDRRILGADLAPPRELEHGIGAGLPRALRCSIGGTIAGDDQLQTGGGVVKRPQVGHARGDHVLLRIGGNDHRYVW